MQKRKAVLIALLKGLIAGAETSALGKMVSTFIAELASMSEDQEQALEALSEDQFSELLTQAELATQNAASAAAGTEQIKEKIDDLPAKLAQLIGAATEKDQQVINNIPYSSIGTLFKGRGDKLNTLIAKLGDKSQATAITQEQKDKPEAIYGLGGIGKTRLAVELGYYALDQLGYDAVLFVNCGQELYDKEQTTAPQQHQRAMSAVERLYAEMAKLAVPDLLDIAGAEAMLPEAAYHEVIKELHSRDKWLLVFDNVDTHDICNAVKATLPTLRGGKVIITSRLANWTGDIKPLELKKLSLEASIDYLQQKTHDKHPSADNDTEKVKALAEKLDGLPVALEQAAAYIIYQSITFEQYLKDFHKVKLNVLGFEAKKYVLADYPEPILRTWALTEQKLAPHAKAVLTISAFLSADNIPEALLLNQSKIVLAVSSVLEHSSQEEVQSTLSGDGDPRAVRDAIAQLNSYSMITRNASDQTFSIHRLVQEVARVRLSDSHKELLTQFILAMIHNDCPDYQTAIKSNFSWHKAMNSHISAITAFTKRLWPDTSATPNALAGPLATQINNLATFYQNQARFHEAEPLMQRALKIDEASLGKDHPHVATALNNLAQLYQATNRLKKAESLMQRALKIDEASLEKDHPDVARDLNNLAQLYQATNRLKEAEPLIQRALKIDEASLGKDHPDVATDLNNLAWLYQATNRHKEAEPLIQRALKIDEASLGKDHPKVAIRLNNLAALYQATNRLKEAEPLIQRALAIGEASLGKDHPKVAIDLNNLAQLYKATNRLKEAGPLMERHLVIFLQFTRRTGHPHPHLETAVNNYTALLLQMGHSQDEITARLKRLAPEFFESPDNQLKEN
jgi:tetratricopeptide (TPR) repeat protein